MSSTFQTSSAILLNIDINLLTTVKLLKSLWACCISAEQVRRLCQSCSGSSIKVWTSIWNFMIKLFFLQRSMDVENKITEFLFLFKLKHRWGAGQSWNTNNILHLGIHLLLMVRFIKPFDILRFFGFGASYWNCVECRRPCKIIIITLYHLFKIQYYKEPHVPSARV